MGQSLREIWIQMVQITKVLLEVLIKIPLRRGFWFNSTIFDEVNKIDLLMTQ